MIASKLTPLLTIAHPPDVTAYCHGGGASSAGPAAWEEGGSLLGVDEWGPEGEALLGQTPTDSGSNSGRRKGGRRGRRQASS